MAKFPSDEHYTELAKKGGGNLVSDDDVWAWHAYTYGWRRIMLQTRDDNSPIDPRREWYNPTFAAQAEIYYSRKFRRRAPDLVTTYHNRERTPEELASASALLKKSIAIIEERSRQTFRGRAAALIAAGRESLRRVREVLGVSSREQIPVPGGETHETGISSTLA